MHPSPPRASARLFVALACLVLALILTPAALARGHAAHHRKSSHVTHHTVAVPPALRAAAARSTLADHHLVTRAKALRACLRGSAGHAGACSASRRSVQRAGRAFTAARRNLATVAGRSGHGRRGARSAYFTQPPALHASGYRLSWSDRHAGGYLLVSEVPGVGNRYTVVRTNSATPPPVPGETVTYMVRTAVRSSKWSNPVRITYPPVPTPPTPTPPAGPPSEELNLRAAPALKVSGQTLSWNLVAGVSTYVLMTKVPGHSETFTVVSGTSVTPPAVPGTTVSYSVRTAVNGSEWAPNVTVTYPAAPKETPPPAPEEVGPSASAEGFQPGINGGTNPLDYTSAVALGAKIIRISMPIGAPASALESIVVSYAAKGIRIAPMASFYGRVPTPAEAQNLASWARAYGPGGTFWAKRTDGRLAIRDIEFGNETSYGYQYGDNAGTPSYQARAQSYALRLKEGAEAISSTGVKVGLLAVADDPSGNWMNGMFQAVPNLGSYVAGWVSHPYGTSGKGKLLGVIAQTLAHGASPSIPIDITEWGIATDGSFCVNDNYGMNPCMSYQEAGEQLKRSVAEMKIMLGSRFGLFLLYQVRDQQAPGASKEREAYFGLLQQGGAAKGGYTTAAQEVLAS